MDRHPVTGASRHPEEPWLRRFHPTTTAEATLVVFPHAGGSASYFHALSQRLAPTLDVLIVQYPGRQDRRHEPCLTSVRALAEGVLPSLLPLPDRPLALLGHSLGASVAFESARLLQSAGREVHALFASGRPGPRAHRDRGLHRAADGDFLQEIRRLAGTDDRLLDDPEIVELVLPALRADYRAAECYVYHPGALLTCPIIALHGDEDDFVPDFDASDWRHETTGTFRLEQFPGGHFYVTEQWDAVASLIGDVVTGRDLAGSRR